MKGIFTTCLLGIACCANAITLFYGGDYNQVGGTYTAYYGATPFTTLIYDDFDVTGQGWTANRVFGRFASLTIANVLYFEIRSGVSSGNGGTVVASGSGPVLNWSYTGFSNNALLEAQLELNIPTINLSAGKYWLAVAPVDPANNAYLSFSSGANSIGTPINNGNSFIVDSGNSFTSSGSFFGSARDFSQGVMGTQNVPEPMTLIAIGFGVAATLRRRKRN